MALFFKKKKDKQSPIESAPKLVTVVPNEGKLSFEMNPLQDISKNLSESLNIASQKINEKYPLALNEGTVLAGQYIIESVLGQGGFGITYVAKDHKSGSKVAIKEFFPDTMATRDGTSVMSFTGERAEGFEYGKNCFLQEAKTLAQFIDNDNIVKIFTYFEENSTAYFVMEYVEGESFDEYIKKKGGKISYREACRLLLPVMDALAAVHDKGIVHRDVTPDNIFICNDGKVKLLDFGAARYSIGDKSKSLDVVLKHGFAPKEQYTRHGRQGAFTDVYSLGATFYYAITGKKLPDSIDRLEEDDMIPPSNLGVDIPEDKEEVLFKAISVQPQDRFQNMRDFAAALKGEKSQEIGKTVAVSGGASYEASLNTSQAGNAIDALARSKKESPLKKGFVLPSIIVGGCVIVAAIIIGIVVANSKPKTNADLEQPTTVAQPAKEDNQPQSTGAGTAQGGGQETETPTTTPKVDIYKTVREITDDIGVFDSEAISNINNGGYVVDTAKDTFVYTPNQGLCIYDDNGLTSLGQPQEYLMANMNAIGNKIMYTYGGTVYLMNDDLTENGVCTDFDENISVRKLYANDIGAFVMEMGDVNDASEPDKLYYKYWETGAQTEPIEVLSNSDIAILEDRVFYITPEKKLEFWSYLNGGRYAIDAINTDEMCSVSQIGFGSDEKLFVNYVVPSEEYEDTMALRSYVIIRDQEEYNPQEEKYGVQYSYYDDYSFQIQPGTEYSDFYDFSVSASHDGLFYFDWHWNLNLLGSLNDSTDQVPWMVKCFQPKISEDKKSVNREDLWTMLFPTKENKYEDTEFIPANSSLTDVCFSKKYNDISFVRYIAFAEESIKVGIYSAFPRD